MLCKIAILYVLCCGINATLKDVIFILDRSGSVESDDFEDAVGFVYNITEWFTIGPADILVSVITFSSNVQKEFDLDDYQTNTTLLNAINELKSISTYGGTRTYEALEYVNGIIYDVTYGARSNASKAVVVLTDGQSASRVWTIQKADLLKNQGVELYAIGIGSAASATNDELSGIASDPDSYYLHTVGYFSYLCVLVPDLVRKLDNETTMNIQYDCPAATTISLDVNTSVTTPTLVIASAISLGVLIGSILGCILLLALITVTTYYVVKKAAKHAIKVPAGTIEAIVAQYTDAPLGERPAVFDYKNFKLLTHTWNLPPVKSPLQMAWIDNIGKPNHRLPPIDQSAVIPFDTLIDLD